MENCEKCAEMFPKKWKNAQILLKSKLIVEECWKCKIVLQIRKSAEKSTQRNRDRPKIYLSRTTGRTFFEPSI